MEDPATPQPAAPEPAPSSAVAPPPETEDWETRFKYLLADFENFRRRTARENDRVRERARGELLRSLLPLFEALDRARESVRQAPSDDPVRRGLELLGQEAATFLLAEGVEPLARVGQPFHAADHEAVAEAPVTADHAEGTIVEVVQQGYSFSGGILRPAKVVVARRPPDRVPVVSEGEKPAAAKESPGE